MLPRYEDSDSDFENDTDDDSENDSDDVSCSDSDNNNDDTTKEFIEKKLSYHQAKLNYSNKQKKLEENHDYQWIEGEQVYDDIPTNEYLLIDKERKKIANSSPTELFELFFSKEMQQYIVEASNLNDLDLSIEELDKFIAIILLSPFNRRTSEKDYWSKDEMLECSIIKSLMSRKRYLKIKSKIKCSKPTDKNENDPVWRVRVLLEMFNKNIKQFGIF